jgi:hypothetical protein
MTDDPAARWPPASLLADSGLPVLREVRGGGERGWVAGLLRVLTPLPEPARWCLLGTLCREQDEQAVLQALWRCSPATRCG